MDHHFTGPSYTIGVEEELMIVDERYYDLVNAIESLVEEAPDGESKRELMESVLEIATRPCNNTVEAGIQLRSLRRQVRETAARRNLAIGSARTHPLRVGGGQRS